MTDRKPHVRVDQHYYLDFIRDYGPQTIGDLAMTFDVSPSTVRRNLDGLVAQGRLTVERRSPWTSSRYSLAPKVITKKEQLKGLPPGRYVLKGEAAEEMRRQTWPRGLEEDHDN